MLLPSIDQFKKWIKKSVSGLFKGYAVMFFQISLGFLFIPDKGVTTI